METLREYVSTLPPGHVPLDPACPRDVPYRIVESDQTGYVPPEVRWTEGEPNAAVVLLAAPGAMGKSAAANWIASTRGSALVNLAELRVGSNSLSGSLVKWLGADGYATFARRLSTGEITLVLDGLDEALLRAGMDNFLAFLDDVAHVARSSKDAPGIVILGRNEAIETSFFALHDGGITVRAGEIRTLTLQQAHELIDLRLDARRMDGVEFNVHRVHRKPFEALREQVLDSVGRALASDYTGSEDWETVRHFLGYPAVLLALAERLAVDNPKAELAQITQAENAGSSETIEQGTLLRRIVETILDRERDKVAFHLGNALALAATDPLRRALYPRREQIARVLNYGLDAHIETTGPETLPESDRKKYEELVAGFVPDHPLLDGKDFSNVVFADYARAFAVTDPLGQVDSPGVLAAGQRGQTPGPFFAQFVWALAHLEESSPAAPVSSRIVPDLIESFRARTPHGNWHLAGRRKSTTRLDLVLGRDTDGTDRLLSFVVSGASEVLVLRSPLSHCSVHTDATVLVEGRSGEVALGPATTIVASGIEFDAESVKVLAPRRTLRAGELDESRVGSVTFEEPGTLLLLAEGPRGYVSLSCATEYDLRVNWPDATHPWTPHVLEVPPLKIQMPEHDWLQVFLTLRRLLVAFRPTASGGLTANSAKISRIVIGESSVSKLTVDVLHELGIVANHGEYYDLDRDTLSNFGVAWASLRGAEYWRGLGDLHRAVCTHPTFVASYKPNN